METLIGLKGQDFVIVLADANVAHSIILVKSDEDKIMNLDDSKIMGAVGETGDRINFSEFIQKNIALYRLKNNVALTTHAAAHFTRNELANALRRNPFQVNLILGGLDEGRASLYYIDYLGTLVEDKFLAHGYGSMFSLSILDQLYKEDLSIEDGLDIFRKCIQELKTRFIIQYPKWTVKILTKEGTKTTVLE
eukprot:GCRY01001986.1.p1 GENE.GCRY01001986.1~~GCRY01001986.1.p1  ORF type:complete len:193 (+),score=4.56 GCRY01001986.1:77-655(+)